MLGNIVEQVAVALKHFFKNHSDRPQAVPVGAGSWGVWFTLTVRAPRARARLIKDLPHASEAV
jgi:hypothetical protein